MLQDTWHNLLLVTVGLEGQNSVMGCVHMVIGCMHKYANCVYMHREVVCT